MNASTPKQTLKRIQTTYSARAPSYDRSTELLSLGLQFQFRRYAVSKLSLRPGQIVLDVACGTGSNFPLLQAAIGREGRLVGWDCTRAMLEQAKKHVERHGWSNVLLAQGDAAQLALAQPADAVLCTFAIGLFPSPHRALEQMVAALRPSGRILIADFKLCERTYGLLVNSVMESIARPWVPHSRIGAYLSARPWRGLRKLLAEIRYEEFLGGILYLAWGIRENV